MKLVKIDEAGEQLTSLIDQARNGEEVVIIDNLDHPVAKIVTMSDNGSAANGSAGRTAGWAKGKIWMAPDFDVPLEDFRDYM